MKRLIIFVMILLVSLTTLSFAEGDSVSLKWLGQSCVVLTMPNGKTIVIDPYGDDIGYDKLKLSADIVLITHEHPDHNNVSAITSPNPTIFHGLTDKGADYNKVSYTKDGIEIYNVNTFHDAQGGKQRGKNTVMVIQINGKKIVHLGDLGHLLNNEQLKSIGHADILLIPVGGFYTIDATSANRVIDQMKPSVVIPIHYKTDKTGKLPISTKDDFLKDKKYAEMKGNEYKFDLKKQKTYREYIVLNYK